MSEAVASNLIPEWDDDDDPLKIILIAGIFVLSVITLTAIAVGISALHSTDHTVAESAYSYRFQPNASVTIPYSTYWKATPTESGPYWLYKEQPTVNTTCLHSTLPDKFTIDRYSKNGELQRIEIVNRYDVPVERDERIGVKALQQMDRRADRLQDRIAALEEGTASQEEVATLHTQLSTLREDFQGEKERIIDQLQAYSDANDEQVLNAAQQYADENDAYSSTDQDDVFEYLTDGIDRLVTLLDPYFATDDRVDQLEQENQRLRNTVSLLLESNDVDTGDVAHYMAANDLEQFRYTGGTCHVYTNAAGAKKVQCAN